MGIFETVGYAWTIFCTSIMTAYVLWAAFRFTQATFKNSADWIMRCVRWADRGAIEETRDLSEMQKCRNTVEAIR